MSRSKYFYINSRIRMRNDPNLGWVARRFFRQRPDVVAVWGNWPWYGHLQLHAEGEHPVVWFCGPHPASFFSEHRRCLACGCAIGDATLPITCSWRSCESPVQGDSALFRSLLLELSVNDMR